MINEEVFLSVRRGEGEGLGKNGVGLKPRLERRCCTEHVDDDDLPGH